MELIDRAAHGEWLDRCVRAWECSVCHKPPKEHFDGYCKDDMLKECPNCHAVMDDIRQASWMDAPARAEGIST